MLAAVREGKVRRIVVFATSRLYRRPIELEALIELAEQSGRDRHGVPARLG